VIERNEGKRGLDGRGRAEGDLHPFVLTLLPLPKWGYSVGNCVKSRAKGSCERSEATI
jgi:hypothetical protein